MIGRGVLRNPWLIKECVDYLEHNIKPTPVTLEERVAMLKKHVDLLIKNISESIVIPKMRTQAAYYLKFQPRTIGVKKAIFQANTKEELFDLLDEYVDKELNWEKF